jgi:propanediol dehydratase large subunit
MSEIRIKNNKEKIVKLLNETIDLQYKQNLKRFKRFSEQVKQVGTKKEPKEVKIKVGHWFEWFYDEDYPNDKKHAVKIERSEIVEVDGKKSNHWNVIQYYSIEDIL